MNFSGFIIRRALSILVILFGLSVLIFVLTRLLPGNPVILALGPRATPDQVAQLTHLWGLDQPFYVQYFHFIEGAFTGHMGISIQTRNDVSVDILTYLPATYELATFAIILSTMVGIILGVVSASHRDKWQDHSSRIFSLLGVSLPDYWVGIMLVLVLAVGARILPVAGRISPGISPPPTITGFYTIDSLLTGDWAAFESSFLHLILPGCVLAMAQVANISRIVRTTMIDERRAEYVQTAVAFGLPSSLVTYKYMLKRALAPAVTMVVLMFAYSFGADVVIEYVFNWPGLGRYLANAIIFKDFNAINGTVLVVGGIIALANLAADIIYGYLDPRIRLQEST